MLFWKAKEVEWTASQDVIWGDEEDFGINPYFISNCTFISNINYSIFQKQRRSTNYATKTVITAHETETSTLDCDIESTIRCVNALNTARAILRPFRWQPIVNPTYWSALNRASHIFINGTFPTKHRLQLLLPLFTTQVMLALQRGSISMTCAQYNRGIRVPGWN